MHRATADASVFHAIADPTRRALLDALLGGEKPVKTLVELVGLGQSAVSQHLAVLRRAGLVSVRKAGRLHLYALDPRPLVRVFDWVGHYERFWEEKLGGLGAYLDANADELRARAGRIERTHDDRGTTP